MPGTVEGGRKARDRNLATDPDFYKKIGAKGGRNGVTGGFYNNPELASRAGKKGGAISRKTTGRKQWEKISDQALTGKGSKESVVSPSHISLLKRIFRRHR